MARRPWTSVEEHFASRHRPYGRNVDPNARNRIEREPAFESASAKAAFNENTVQDPEDRHGAKYDGDASGWVRGAKGEPTGFNETGENYPGGNFDRGSAWRQPDKTIHGPDAGDRTEFVKPERITVNAKQRRND
jgi:hypothetical protein